MEDKECYYGCGNKASFFIGKTTKRYCCSTHRQKCPEIKRINSLGLKKAILEGRKTYDYYDSLPEQTKERMKWSKGKTKLSDERVKKQSEKRMKNFKEGKFKIKPTGVAANDELRWKKTKYQTFDSLGNPAVLESKNEIIFSEICNKHSIRWTKSERRKLKSGKSFQPDFYLIDYDMHIDPKSHYWIDNYNKNQLEKIEAYQVENNTKIVIFWDTDIKNWEKDLLDIVKSAPGPT